MNKFILIVAFILCSCFLRKSDAQNYDTSYVSLTSFSLGNSYANAIFLHSSASRNRIKMKCFVGNDDNGASVSKRFSTWSVGKNIICVTSGGYMDNSGTPDGLTIDNGVIINSTIESYDGLTMVYSTGGIRVSNLDNADLKLQGKSISDATKSYDIRNSALDRQNFLNWAESENVTIFQTHLLVYNNHLQISSTNSAKAPRARRFLAAGKRNNEVVHVIINVPNAVSLYDGSFQALKYLNEYQELNVSFMINLESGHEDVFFLFDENGKPNTSIRGTRPLEEAVNLLVYYYE